MLKQTRGKTFLLILLLTFNLLYSCKEEEKGYLYLPAATFNFSLDEQTYEFEVHSNENWYTSLSNNWFSISPTLGNGNQTVTMNVTANKSDTTRTARLTFSINSHSDTILIIQKGQFVQLDPSYILIDQEGTPVEVQLTSRYPWTLEMDEEISWLTVTPMQGEGDATITFTTAPYTERTPRLDAIIRITCQETVFEFTADQEIENAAPSSPRTITPRYNSQQPGIYPAFRWTESIDPDDDPVYYDLLISADFQKWEPLAERLTERNYTITKKLLEENTDYYWKVRAYDDFRGSTESNISKFTTGENIVYEEGEILVLQEASMEGLTPIRLVIIGDGYIEEDYGKGNQFDVNSETAMEAFFSIEPFTTYRKYFTVYQLVAYSIQRGATVEKDFEKYDVKRQSRNTAFSSVFAGEESTSITCDSKKVFTFVAETLDLTDEELDKTTILMMINLDVYAGTTAISKTGRSIAMCPVGEETFEEVVYHECGGHGFGRLLDEYIEHPSSTLPDGDKNVVINFRDGDPWNLGANISFTNDLKELHWAHFIGRTKYNDVGLYEGALNYGKGVWRPEQISCMMDNSPFFNAPSRESIVRRVMTISGEGFDYDTFYKKDIIPTPTKATRSYITPKTHLSPPQLIE